MVNSYLEAADTLPQNLDLLVIDECQDFDIEWVQALSSELSAKGRLYVLGDIHQQLYEREPFDLPHAVRRRGHGHHSVSHALQEVSRQCEMPEVVGRDLQFVTVTRPLQGQGHHSRVVDEDVDATREGLCEL